MPATTVSSAAASATDRVIGPAVSKPSASGMTPARLTSPRVGLTPTSPLTSLGDRIDPEVSDPKAPAAKAIDSPTPEPDDEPLGSPIV